MRFGTDLAQSVPVRWFRAEDSALDLGFPTPFVSRIYTDPGAWPDLGEVEYTREHDETGIPIPLPGTSGPCGSAAVWAAGYQGTIPPIFPLNDFGIPPCCNVLAALEGQPSLGMLAFSPDEAYQYFGDDYFGENYFGDDYFY